MPRDEERSERSRSSRVTDMIKTYGLVAVVAVLAVKSCDWPGKAWNDTPPKPTEQVQNQPAAAPAITAEALTEALAHKEARAKAVLQLNRFKELYNTAKVAIATLETNMTAWETKTRELNQGDQGKRIAANPEALKEAKQLLDAPRAKRETIARLRSDADSLLVNVDEALAKQESIWTPETSTAQISEIIKEARAAGRDYADALGALESLITRTADQAPADKTLAQASKQIDDEHAKAHAAEMQKIADEARDAREKREIDEAKDRNRRAAIARDPKALKLLNFTGLDRPGEDGSGCWMACFAADAYENPAKLYDYGYSGLKAQIGRAGFGRDWEMNDAVRNEFKERDQLAQSQFGMSLHELFKVVALSEANQKRFGSDDGMRKAIEAAQAKGNQKDASDWAAILAKGKKLPKPQYP